jgi:hypothetical protein
MRGLAPSMERLERLLGHDESWALHHKFKRIIIKADIEKTNTNTNTNIYKQFSIVDIWLA